MRKLAIMIAVVLGGLQTTAECDRYLYWSVKESDVVFVYAKIGSASAGDETLSYLDVGGEWATGDKFGAQGIGVGAEGMFAVLPSTLQDQDVGLLFMVEVFNEAGVVVGGSDWFSFQDISSQFVYTDMGTSLVGMPYGVSIHVPEPTSMLLFLLGAAGLGLRRKRV